MPLLERAIEENPNNAQAGRRSAPPACAGNAISNPPSRRCAADCAHQPDRLPSLGLAHGAIQWPGPPEPAREALDAAQGACRSDAKFYPARIVLALLTKLGKEAEALKALAERAQPPEPTRRPKCGFSPPTVS